MTAQAREKVIYEGEELSMACCPPLPKDLPDNEHQSKDEDWWILKSTACHRGYIATWEIKESRFYLVGLRGPRRLPNNEPMLADWFTGNLDIAKGKVLSGGFNPVYEATIRVRIRKGVVVDTCILDNRTPSGIGGTHYRQGFVHFRNANYENAISAFGKAIRLHPDFASAYGARARAHELQGDFVRAAQDLEQVLSLTPGAVTVYREELNSFFCSNWESARKVVQQELSRVRGQTGIAFLEQGDCEKAISECTASIKLYRREPVQFVRGKAYFATGCFEKALRDLQAFALSNPQEKDVLFEVYVKLSKCHLEKRAYKHAILDAGTAIRLKPQDPEAYFIRSSAYFETGEYSKAVADLTILVQLRSDFPDAFEARAKAYRALDAFDKAEEDGIRAAQLRKDGLN